MAYDTCLHPDLIDEMIEELFEIDIISEDQIKKLKNNSGIIHIDPNVLMDVRHKEVKKESLIDFSSERKAPDKINLKMENLCKESHIKVKDLKTIDKEILNTRKCLEDFKKKLEQKNEGLQNSILDLEKEKFDIKENVDEKEKYPSIVEELNGEETVQYFNLHLDHLENTMSRNRQEDSEKTWRPVELISPVIHGISTFEEYEGKLVVLKNKEKENKGLKMYGLNPATSLERQTEDLQTVYVPYNSPTFQVSVTLDDKYKLSAKQHKTIQKAIKTWKLYAKKNKIKKWSESKALKLRTNLLKKYVSLWISYTKQPKNSKAIHLSRPSDTLEIVPAKCCINQKKVGMGNVHKGEPEESRDQTNTDKEQAKSLSIKKKKAEVACKKVVITSTENNDTNSSKHLENPIDKLEIHVKTVTPQDVGLVQKTNTITSQACKKQLGKRDMEAKDLTFRSMGEPMFHRFEAQEKIIKQQREVIEKQKRIIFDLQGKCLEIESKLNWTLAERQLAEAESNNKRVSKHLVISDNKPVQNSETKHSKSNSQEASNISSRQQDNSKKIVKNMLERQAYCSQLAEQTKQRKKRLQEEKERLKLEQEEKQIKEKEEERKNRILRMKMEQQMAKEKELNTIANKKMEAELSEKARKHYTNYLLRKTFARLKLINLEILVRSEDCDRIYRQKLTRKMFYIWKEKVKQSIQAKFEFAENYYSEKLLRLAWDGLCKVRHDYRLRLQVSEDLYNLKLQERMFRRWQTFTAQQFLQACCKIELAERLHRRQLLRHYFGYWRELPRLMFREREKEQRRRVWRETVKQLIPDFTPAYVDET